MAAPAKRFRRSESTRRRFLSVSKSNARTWRLSANHFLSGTRRSPLSILEMMKPRWSDRVCVGVSKQPLSGTRTMPGARSVSSMICRVLVASSKGTEQIVDIKQEAHAVSAERCCYYQHDSCPNSGRGRPPERQGRMGELDHLMVKVAQVQRRLTQWHQWREVWSGADKVTS